MKKDILNVTPAFLLKLMKHSSKLESPGDVISTFQKLSQNQHSILTPEDIVALEKEDEEIEAEVPDHLQDMKNALEGAVSDLDD